MSVVVKYKGNTIASASTDTTKTLKTSGKYCEADIEVINTPDSGDAPVINPLSVTSNGTYTAPAGVDGYAPVTVNVPQGVFPSGSVTLTEEDTYDVTDKAQAVVDFSATRADLAEAVTAKGVDTLPTASFDTIATNIGLIEGGISVDAASAIETVTIGANTVANPVSAVQYLGKSSYPKGCLIVLLDNVTVNNQIVFICLKPNAYGSWCRYRDNAFNYPDTLNETWSAFIVEGTRYLIIEY